MTPKEKAIELYEKYFYELPVSSEEEYDEAAYTCAMICVNEIISALRKDLPEIGLGKGYWASVKKELDSLK
jgi:hypothetical protein